MSGVRGVSVIIPLPGVVHLFALHSHASGRTGTLVSVFVVVVLYRANALSTVETLRSVGTIGDSNLAFLALEGKVRAVAVGARLGGIIGMRNIFARGEAAGGSVLAVQRVATDLAVVSAPAQGTQALSGLAVHTRIFGFLRIVGTDTQTAVLAVLVLVAWPVPVLDVADGSNQAVDARSVLGAVARGSPILRGALSSPQTIQ